MGATKKSKLEIEKILAETKMAELDVRKGELNVKLGELALKSQEISQLEHTPLKTKDADFTIIDDNEKKNQTIQK